MKRIICAVLAALTVAVLGGTAAQAGASGGPKHQVTTVRQLSSDTFEVTFRAGEQAIVVVSGDGSTDLDLFVYDGRDTGRDARSSMQMRLFDRQGRKRERYADALALAAAGRRTPSATAC